MRDFTVFSGTPTTSAICLNGMSRNSRIRNTSRSSSESAAIARHLVAGDHIHQRAALFARVHRSVERCVLAMFASPSLVNAQVARDGVKPRRKFGLTLVRLRALDD